MKKMVLAASCAVAAMMMTGCSRSPSSVAEKFVDAVLQRDADDALDYMDTNGLFEGQIKAKKEVLEAVGKDINDNKLEAEAEGEEILVPPEDAGYRLLNGKKYTGETATVTVRFVKGKDKKDEGMRVELVKVDGSWKVKDYDKANLPK